MSPLKSGKALGGCGMYAEMLKAVGAATLPWLHSVVFHMEHGAHPDGLETGQCRVNQGKDDTQDCNNYWGLPFSLCQQGPGTNFSQRGPPKTANSPAP